MEITIDCIIFCINNINKFTLITSAFVFSARKEEQAPSFLESFLKEGATLLSAISIPLD